MEEDAKVEASAPNSNTSISLQRILGSHQIPLDASSTLVEVNARNNNVVLLDQTEATTGTRLSTSSTGSSVFSPPTKIVDNEDESNSNVPSPSGSDDPNSSTNSNPVRPPRRSDDGGQTSMNVKSKRPRPKAVSASSALLEAKKAAQAQQRVTRNSTGSRNSTEFSVKEPEIVVMKDHLQPARDTKGVNRKPTGVVYDLKMLEHHCIWDPNYPEKPERLSAAVDRCQKLGLLDRCVPLVPRYAAEEEVLSVHTAEHIQKLKEICSTNDAEKLEESASHYDAVYFHPSTYQLSLLSVGCTVDLVDAVMSGTIQNGMAIIRPPGHHAMKAEYCGYCFFNNVAIAAQRVLDSSVASKILIVDFDVHHGQATQQTFYNDSRVLYFSTHRFEHGNFWPNLEESDYNFIGAADGVGFNCNVPLNKTGLGNADFLTIWHQLLLPMAYEFKPELVIVSAGYDCLYGCFEFSPELVIVSAGFDSLQGDEKGEMDMTPQCVPHLLWPLLGLANGKVAVILEGGYCIKSLAEGAALSLRALLGDPCPMIPKISEPFSCVSETILNSTYMLRPFWNMLAKQRVADDKSCDELANTEMLHTPTIKYEWTFPKPTTYGTRNCYPEQEDALQKEIDAKLDSLILTTNLAAAKNKVGIVYDDLMLKHRNLREPYHPETPERISNIFANHADYGLLERCARLQSREVTEEELLLIHSREHIELMKKTQNFKKNELEKLQNNFNSVYFNSSSYQAALISAGSVLEVVDNVLDGRCQSGVAIVRPPGHHAEEGYPCGFCIFNNVALAAKYAIENNGLERILIVDWDVHHGNGIQRMFESDPRVLYVSIHRYDNGFFFPSSPDANYDVVGEGKGKGYTVNVPWNQSKMGDTEYLAVFTNIILPIAYEFNPELVLVSAGFDAAKGDPLGGCSVTPEGYAHMTHMLSALANGKVILALEGGYNLMAIAYSMVLCTKALLGDPIPPLSLNKKIHPEALQSIQNVLDVHSNYWTVLKPFRKHLNNKKTLIDRGMYEKDLEERMASIQLEEDKNNNENDNEGNTSTSSNEARTIPRTSEPRLSEPALSPGKTESTVSPAKSPQPYTLTVHLGLEEELGACGGTVGNDAGGSSMKHTVVLSQNFDAQGPAGVYPSRTCPHLAQVQPVPEDGSMNPTASCSECGHQGENYICLCCYKIFCGRYANGHMVEHSGQTGHLVALGFADLSIWCYGCDSYVKHEKLFPAFSAAHVAKFDSTPPEEIFR